MRRQRKKLAQVARIQARGQLHIPTQGSTHDQPEAEFDEALAAFGLQQGELDGDETPAPPDKCYLWPCNVAAFNTWQRLQTQWRVGMGGRTGLDYTAVTAYLREVLGLKPKARIEMFGGLQAMESAALDEWGKQQD